MADRAARYRLIGLAFAGAVFALDQLVKWWVTGPLGIAEIGDAREIVAIFDLRFTRNYGVSLGLFTAESQVERWGLVALTALIATVVTVWLLRERKFADIAALSLILGGALGNIYDRTMLGYVVDYADLHFGEWRPFLIFNLADAAITCGVIIILARSFFARDKAPANEPPPAEASGPAAESQT